MIRRLLYHNFGVIGALFALVIALLLGWAVLIELPKQKQLEDHIKAPFDASILEKRDAR